MESKRYSLGSKRPASEEWSRTANAGTIALDGGQKGQGARG
jgi:hypothetical protein